MVIRRSTLNKWDEGNFDQISKSESIGLALYFNDVSRYGLKEANETIIEDLKEE